MPPREAPTGIEAVYLDNRDKLIRFLRARGAGEQAEDIFQELWLKVSGKTGGPIGNPLAYLFRAADLLMIDRYRAQKQAEQRDEAWGESHTGVEPPVDHAVTARQEAARVAALLAELGPRKEAIFRRARIDGVPQRQIAAELDISISTVESDLRITCQALAELRERMR